MVTVVYRYGSKGSAKSGNYAHAGRAGKVGGSAPKSKGIGMLSTSIDNVDMVDQASKLNAYWDGVKGTEGQQITTTADAISKATGLSAEDASMVGLHWNGGCGSTATTASLQRGIAAEFDLSLPSYIDEVESRKYGGPYSPRAIVKSDVRNTEQRLIGMIGSDNSADKATLGYLGRSAYETVEHAIRNDKPGQETVNAMSQFSRAQYNYTQEQLKAAGITHIEVYRGIRYVKHAHAVGDNIDMVGHMPIYSWTTDPKIADRFSRKGYIIKAVVPVERVYGTWATGIGTKRESEIVVLGGDKLSGVASVVKLGTKERKKIMGAS